MKRVLRRDDDDDSAADALATGCFHRQQEENMSTLSTDRKPLVDYGVQIRFIKDLEDTGGGYQDKSRGNSNATPTNKYGVAVRVQGISGQPYVVLKDGEKGDSYGVQLNTPTSSSGSTSPYNSLPKTNKEPAEFTNPYNPAVNAAQSPVSPAEDEEGEIFGSPLKRPPGDGQAGTQGEEEGGARREGRLERRKAEPQPKASAREAENGRDRTSSEEYNEAGLKPVKLNGVGARGVKQTAPGFTGSLGRYSGKKLSAEPPPKSFPEPAAPAGEEPAAPAIDTNSLAPINKLISKFNYGTPGSAPQTRGRSGARQRLRFDERKRSRSLDARKDVQPEVSPPPPTSPTLNPYAAPLSTASSLSLSSRAPAGSGLGRSPAPFTKVSALEAPKPSFKSPGKFVARNFHPSVAKKPKGGSDASPQKANLEQLQLQLNRCKKELQQAYDELDEERMTREGAEIRLCLQEDQLAELQEELRRVSENSPRSDSLQMDVVTLQADLAEAAMLRQRQEDTLHQRERELTALKGALKEEVECHDREMEVLREQYSQDMDNLRQTMEQSQEQIEEERERVNASMLTLEDELESCRDDREQWKTQLEVTAQELDSTREELLKSCLEKEEFESKLRDLQDSLLAMKKQMPASDDNRSSAEELQRCHDNLKRTRADLDKQKGESDEKSKALQAQKKESGEKEAALLSEISRLKEQSQKDVAELEKALEKAKEMEMMMGDSRQSVAALQAQLDEYRERSRKDLLEAQRNGKERLAELQRSQNNLKAQLEEVSRLKKDLLLCSEERDSAQLERDLLSNRLKHLESELDSEKSTYTDRTREIRGLEDKIKALEIELDEERSSVELLNDRVTRSRDQVDQLRSELMQERSARHDLEMDKSAIERQLKELKSRVADMEGQTRPSAGIPLLEIKIQELEERLRSEEREKASIQGSQRRMERKLKELNATLDQERSQHVEQRDQLSLRVKALKRQVDESEGEVERLEGVRRKVLRDLEEQQELQEALQAKVTALENELKRKSQHTLRTALGSSTLSSEDEDGFYDTNITAILHESHLQTTNS
ncbi:hypothetical protein F2P81_023368 [Scophthalmus maximus]|uniref:Myosin tail domain-containing protein n=1 Tax=Scophthalmus maximus TaxID=52904 RepID=A0A6A4RPQ0_SCOMX|nr:hypothetical protein F2P81_023368 [Scophthalmus maximus]